MPPPSCSSSANWDASHDFQDRLLQSVPKLTFQPYGDCSAAPDQGVSTPFPALKPFSSASGSASRKACREFRDRLSATTAPPTSPAIWLSIRPAHCDQDSGNHPKAVKPKCRTVKRNPCARDILLKQV